MIPVLSVTSDKENNLLCGEVVFDNVQPRLTGSTEDFRASLSKVLSKDERRKIAILDVKGLQRKTINDVLLKKLKIRNADVWYIANIESVDDIFDAFNTDAEKVFVPTNTIRSQAEAEDILKVSDSAVPTIFVWKGNGIYLGKQYRVDKLADMMFSVGYPEICVWDTDGSLSIEQWKDLSEYGKIIPCTNAIKIEEMEDVFENCLRCLPTSSQRVRYRTYMPA